MNFVRDKRAIVHAQQSTAIPNLLVQTLTQDLEQQHVSGEL